MEKENKVTKPKETKPKAPKIDITKKEPIDKSKDSNVKKEATKPKKITQHKKIKRTVDIIKRYDITAIVMIALALFIFSFVIAAQLNTVGNTDIISQGMREADLLNELQKSKEAFKSLQEDYEASKEIVEEYKTSESNNDTLIASMKTELERANVLAGLTDVQGEGVVVTLEDSADETLPVEARIVHDTDLRAIVTELKAAGAEAISINGQRIITTTAIRCVGPTIQINSTKVATPFYIKAIGNAKYLESALRIKNGVLDSLVSYGFKADVETNNKIIIDKYDSNIKLKYASEKK